MQPESEGLRPRHFFTGAGVIALLFAINQISPTAASIVASAALLGSLALLAIGAITKR